MHAQSTQTDDQVRRNQEAEVLQRYALRWAVLAAWQTELARRAVPLPAEVKSSLEISRIKISSGCFSPCEVGCDLRALEGTLTAADSSSPDEQTDRWLELLGRAMTNEPAPDELLSVPAIRIRFNDCRSRGCACGA
jgi:hypothetical protein